jgi:DNA-directed RNA polymerase subunit L
MEITAIESKKNRLVLEIRGETHTIPNALKRELWNVEGVTVAGYNIEHPLIDKTIFILETNSKITPQAAVKKAIDNLKKTNASFKKLVEKEFK